MLCLFLTSQQSDWSTLSNLSAVMSRLPHQLLLLQIENGVQLWFWGFFCVYVTGVEHLFSKSCLFCWAAHLLCFGWREKSLGGTFGCACQNFCIAGFFYLEYMTQKKKQTPKYRNQANPGSLTTVLFLWSQAPQLICSLLYLSESPYASFICNTQGSQLYLAGGIGKSMSIPSSLTWKAPEFSHINS